MNSSVVCTIEGSLEIGSPCLSRILPWWAKFVINKVHYTKTPRWGRIIYITISTFTSFRPYGVRRPSGGVPLRSFQFLQAYEKVSLIKVAWYVFRVKNIHSWSPPDPLGPWDEEKASYIHYNIRREEAKLRILKLASVFHHLRSVSPKQLCALAHLECTREAGTFYSIRL